jgi:hypothetical protein
MSSVVGVVVALFILEVCAFSFMALVFTNHLANGGGIPIDTDCCRQPGVQQGKRS